MTAMCSSDLQTMLTAMYREQQVLALTAKGLLAKEVACRMNLTRTSVKKLKWKGMRRRDLHNTAHVVHHAIQQGWVGLGEVEK